MALKQARRGSGKTHPNPAVGAVIVKNERMIGYGYHRRAGEAHAEIEALQCAGYETVKGADCYVTLEPCNHQGKTPPCTDALIQYGIRRVFISMLDPNPTVRGGGAAKLAKAGIEVHVGMLEKEALQLNESWIKWITTGRPFVIMKIASSMDGKVATTTGQSRWISCPESRRHAHRIRQQVGAILIGRGTIEADNPGLTARIGDRVVAAPLRVIADSHLRSPIDSVVFQPGFPGHTIVAIAYPANPERQREFMNRGVEVFEAGALDDRTNLKVLLEELGRRGIESVLVEGGPGLNATLLQQELVDKVMLYQSPMLIGGLAARSAIAGEGLGMLQEVPRLGGLRIRHLGQDLLIMGYPEYRKSVPDEGTLKVS